ncbi:glycosyltransferase family 2 protein [Streptomyces afghaniensis]|uniref:glycosyltransferase family 2 protein n=1 Tax=Streptomyces TaxID=1883 RepID=UPI001FAEE538|nr:glycosyltransferase [Streptomyces sp. HP-A2021]UOB12714.1 glycosyltransferase [Streptomyces sp. HP-A2021]
MSGPKFSIVIPYKQRLDNIRLCFESLAEQSLEKGEFEVLVGVMEYSPEYVALCQEFTDRLTVVSVLSGDEWQITRARNMAMRQASGQVMVQLDADMALPPRFLENLYRKHFAYGQNVCVIGQMIGYDNNNSDVDDVDVRPFGHYREKLAELDAADEVRMDMRLQVDHVVPWAFAWTALIALPTALVVENDLYFDEDFRGYGVEDLEWAHRICATGTPIVMGRDVYGIHLPHKRSVAGNRATERLNYRRFVRKWPGPDVELAAAFGDFEANGLALDFRRELSAVAGDGRGLAVIRGEVNGESVLVIGAVLDSGQPLDGAVCGVRFDARPDPEVLPVAGLALPFADQSIDVCRVLPAVTRLSDRYLKLVLAEADRVARTVTGAAGPEPDPAV